MTVSELIKKLEKLDHDLPVVRLELSAHGDGVWEENIKEAYETIGLETLRRVVLLD